MKKIYSIVFISVVLAACQKQTRQSDEPYNVQDVSTNSQPSANPHNGYIYTMSNEVGGK